MKKWFWLLAAYAVVIFLFVVSAKAEEKPAAVLVSVHLDSRDCSLSITMQEGRKDKGEFRAERIREYKIDVEKAVMTGQDAEGKEAELSFSKREAEAVHQLIHVLLKYGAESAFWFEDGGDKNKPDGKDTVAKR